MNNVHLVWNLDLASVSRSPHALPAVAAKCKAKQNLSPAHLHYLHIRTCFPGMCHNICMGPLWSNPPQEKGKKKKPSFLVWKIIKAVRNSAPKPCCSPPEAMCPYLNVNTNLQTGKKEGAEEGPSAFRWMEHGDEGQTGTWRRRRRGRERWQLSNTTLEVALWLTALLNMCVIGCGIDGVKSAILDRTESR